MKKLTIYTGCMCSGKSMLLIRAYRLRPLDTDVYTFGKGDIVSRGGYRTLLTATHIESIADIKPVKKNIIIDECQFFDNWKIADVIAICNQYERVYLSGLDWIQPAGSDTFTKTQFYNNVCADLHQLECLYILYGLLAKNDITGVWDARISKRKEGAKDVRNKNNYININFQQAFNK